MKSVTKLDLVQEISSKTGIIRIEVKETMEALFEEIERHLVNGERIEIRDFGVFESKTRKATKKRLMRYAKSGISKAIEVEIPVRKVLLFKASIVLKKRVNERAIC